MAREKHRIAGKPSLDLIDRWNRKIEHIIKEASRATQASRGDAGVRAETGEGRDKVEREFLNKLVGEQSGAEGEQAKVIPDQLQREANMAFEQVFARYANTSVWFREDGESLDDIQMEKLKAAYTVMYTMCKEIDVVEGNGSEETAERAYKMMLLCVPEALAAQGRTPTLQHGIHYVIRNSLKTLQGFVKAYGSQLGKPIHDIFKYNFNPDARIRGAEWKRNILNELGLHGIEALAEAHRISEVPSTRAALEEITSVLTYSRARENIQFATICMRYRVPELEFNRALNIIADFYEKNPEGRKESYLPDVMVSGDELEGASVRERKCIWVKLPPNDSRAYIIGNIVHCCQHVLGHSERCVVDSAQRENNGVYVLMECPASRIGRPPENWDNLEKNGYKIVAEAYTWRSVDDGLCLDSLEALKTHIDIATRFVRKFAEKIVAARELGIHRVTIGRGGTPFALRRLSITLPEIMKEGFQYMESKHQTLVAEDLRLPPVRQELNSLGISEEVTRSIISFEQAQDFMHWIKANHSVIVELSPEKKDSILKIILIDARQRTEVDELVKYSAQKLQNMSSLDCWKMCRAGFVTLEQVSAINNMEKLRALMSNKAVRVYEAGVKFSELNAVDNIEKLKTLTSNEAVMVYEAGVKFSELNAVDNIEKLKTLTSYGAVMAYEAGVKFSELNAVDNIEKLKALTFHSAGVAYKAGVKFSELNAVDNIEKLKALTSYGAAGTYQAGVKFSELNAVDNIEKLKALTSYGAVMAYEAGVKFSELNAVDNIEKLKALRSNEAVRVYEAGVVFKELGSMLPEKREALLSPEAAKAYQAGIKFEELSKLWQAQYAKAHLSRDPRGFDYAKIFKEKIEEALKAKRSTPKKDILQTLWGKLSRREGGRARG